MLKQIILILYRISLILILIFSIGIIIYSRKLKIISKKIKSIKDWLGVNPLIPSSSKSRREWQTIQDLIEEEYESSWKLAVIKTEALVENLLKQLGFQGNNFNELLISLKLKGYQNIHLLEGTHQVCQEILNNKDFQINQKEALNIIAIYKRFWDELMKNIL